MMRRVLSMLCLAITVSCQSQTTVDSIRAATGTQGPAQGRYIDVIILAGQSNAQGDTGSYAYGTDPMLPAYLQGDFVHRSWNEGFSYSWRDELLHPATSRYWGVELTALDTIYKAYGRQLGLVKVAIGGTSLAVSWAQGSYSYTHLVSNIIYAKADLEADGYTVDFKQFWWIQGESDTASNEWATAYADNFINLWTNLCADTGMSTNTSIALAPLGASVYTNPNGLIVKSNQTWLVDNYANIDAVDVSSLTYQPSGSVHYTPESYMELGERFATNYMAKFGPSPISSISTNGTIVQ